LNRYLYGEADPLGVIDPDGRLAQLLIPLARCGLNQACRNAVLLLGTATAAAISNLLRPDAPKLTLPSWPSGWCPLPGTNPPPDPVADLQIEEGVGDNVVMMAGNRGGRQGKGERNRAAKPEGTPNKYKHMKSHPTDPTKVVVTIHTRAIRLISRSRPIFLSDRLISTRYCCSL
jgi:hypothetical protein